MKRLCLAWFAAAAALYADDPCCLINSYRPAVEDGADVWIDVSVLYWKPKEQAVVATNKTSDVFTTDDFTQAPLAHPHFEWDLGYRISGGALFCSNLWDVEGSWTHFTADASQRRSSGGSAFLGMFPIWSLGEDVIPGDYVFESDLKWELCINTLDLQLGRYLPTFRRLELKPFVGLRSAWIRQNGDVVYEGGMFLIGILQPGISLYGADLIKLENNYWGLGPRVGIDPRLILGKGFSIDADAAISGLYGFFNVRQKEIYLETTRFSHHEHLNRFRWIGDLAAGLQWKTLFTCDRYALTLRADWEYHIFFDQFQLKKDAFDLVPDDRNLSTQGVTFTGRFDF